MFNKKLKERVAHLETLVGETSDLEVEAAVLRQAIELVRDPTGHFGGCPGWIGGDCTPYCLTLQLAVDSSQAPRLTIVEHRNALLQELGTLRSNYSQMTQRYIDAVGAFRPLAQYTETCARREAKERDSHEEAWRVYLPERVRNALDNIPPDIKSTMREVQRLTSVRYPGEE